MRVEGDKRHQTMPWAPSGRRCRPFAVGKTPGARPCEAPMPMVAGEPHRGRGAKSWSRGQNEAIIEAFAESSEGGRRLKSRA